MILSKIGGAAGIDAIFDDSDPIDVEATNDRPARGAGRKGRAGDAWLGEQKIAKLGGALAADLLVRHYGDGCELVGHDRQHTLLWRGRDRRWRCLRRAVAVCARNR